MPVFCPSRACANHHFSGGHDLSEPEKEENKIETEYLITVTCTEKEKKILELIRRIPFGEITVSVRDSEPIRIDEIKSSIKL